MSDGLGICSGFMKVLRDVKPVFEDVKDRRTKNE